MGKIKKVRLSEKEQDELRDKLAELTGNRIKLIFAFALCVDALVNSVSQTLANYNVPFDGERKRSLAVLSEKAKGLDCWYEKAVEGFVTEQVGWRDYDGYRRDANEQIRVCMKYLNAAQTTEKRDAIFAVLDKLAEGEKPLFRDSEIERFDM